MTRVAHRRFSLDSPPLVLDGGFSTQCEALGADLSIGKLWSARLINDDPDLVARVHRSFLDNGADLVSTASYQATLRGLVAAGSTPSAAAATLRRSVEIAVTVRDAWWSERTPAARAGRERPLVGASIGSYGAFLGNGAEYTGAYGELGGDPLRALVAFHREQAAILAATGADLLMWETVPCAVEARAIVALLQDEALDIDAATLTFCCRDGAALASGESIIDAVVAADLVSAAPAALVALGVNCTPPHFIAPLLAALRSATTLPLIAYANSGETWVSPGDADGVAASGSSGWHGADGATAETYAALARGWLASGDVCVVGGCCRTTPEHTRLLRAAVDERVRVVATAAAAAAGSGGDGDAGEESGGGGVVVEAV